MKDFITNMFNLEPRIIHDIEIISSDNAVFAVISLRKAEHPCPVCKSSSSKTHSYRKRVSYEKRRLGGLRQIS